MEGRRLTGPGVSHVHWERIDERAFAVAARALEQLEASATPYVLAGGWAAYAYGTGVPSVDTDVFVPRASWQQIQARLPPDLQQGEARLELLDMDGLNAMLGADPEMGVPEQGYVPRELFEGRTRRVEVDLPPRRLAARVPEPDALLLTKLKAYYDREFAWRALRSPETMAMLSPGDRVSVREWTESYYYRKAGKDLYDVACLSVLAAPLEQALDLARRWGISEILQRPLRRPAFPLVELARDFARVRDQRDVDAWLKRLGA